MGQISGLSRKEIEEKSKEMFHIFAMEGMADIPAKYLSKGTLQKVAVIQAFLTRPDLLLMDEPLSGQDIKSQKVFWALVKEVKKQGTAIVMS